MFKNLKQIFNPKNKDIRSRILYTLLALLIFEIGNTIVVPGAKGIISDLGSLEILNAITGGGLKKFSIFGLGVMPYISASIFISLIQMVDIIPYFTELKESGEIGRQKLNQITRYIGIGLGFVQGFFLAFAFLGDGATTIDYLKSALIMTAGTSFLLWLGDRITKYGLGNGMSLIIMAGIISTVPKMFIDAYGSLVGTQSSLFIGIVSYTLFILVYLIIIVGIIFVEQSERRIPIQYANQTTSAYGKKQTYIPFKLNSSGVMPVIFASTLMSIPSFIAKIIEKDGGNFTLFVEKYLTYTTPIGFLVYMLLIFGFGYFYVFLQINPDELSKNLGRNAGYIPGIRPGKETGDYIKKVLSRLTLIGSIFLMIIAGMPIIFSNIGSLPSSVTLGGTGMLIVIGVALETYKQLESSLVNRTYKGGK